MIVSQSFYLLLHYSPVPPLQKRDVKGASIEIRLSNDGKDKWALEIEHSGYDFPESRQTRSEKGAGGCAVVEKDATLRWIWPANWPETVPGK